MSAPTASDQEKLKKLKTLQGELAKAFAEAKKYTGTDKKDVKVFEKIEDLLNQIAKLTEPATPATKKK